MLFCMNQYSLLSPFIVDDSCYRSFFQEAIIPQLLRFSLPQGSQQNKHLAFALLNLFIVVCRFGVLRKHPARLLKHLDLNIPWIFLGLNYDLLRHVDLGLQLRYSSPIEFELLDTVLDLR